MKAQIFKIAVACGARSIIVTRKNARILHVASDRQHSRSVMLFVLADADQQEMVERKIFVVGDEAFELQPNHIYQGSALAEFSTNGRAWHVFEEIIL